MFLGIICMENHNKLLGQTDIKSYQVFVQQASWKIKLPLCLLGIGSSHLWNFWPVEDGCQAARLKQTGRKQSSVYILTFIFHMEWCSLCEKHEPACGVCFICSLFMPCCTWCKYGVCGTVLGAFCHWTSRSMNAMDFSWYV